MPSNNVENRNRNQHFHEPGEVVGVNVGPKVDITGSVHRAINLWSPRSNLQNSKQSQRAGKEQHGGTKQAPSPAASACEKLGGEEKERQVRPQQHQRLAGLEPIKWKLRPRM